MNFSVHTVRPQKLSLLKITVLEKKMRERIFFHRIKLKNKKTKGSFDEGSGRV